MTPDELTRLKELGVYATPGPWYFNAFGHRAEIVDDEDNLVIETRAAGDQERRDVHLMVEARNALPHLLDRIERLTRRLEIAEKRLGRVARNHPEAYAQALVGDDQ